MIKLTIYVDCNVTGNAFSPINFFCAQTGAVISSLSLSGTSQVDVTPICNSSCTRCQSASCPFPYGIKRYIMQ